MPSIAEIPISRTRLRGATAALAALAAFGLGVIAIPSAPAQTFTVLYSFTKSSGDGANPSAGLIRDGAGNLYGTTLNGGSLACSPGGGVGCGTVFRLDTSGNETV